MILSNAQRFKNALLKGERLYGTLFVTARTGRWDHTIGHVGFDYIIIDNERAPYSRAETADWMAKLHEMKIVPFIRLPYASAHHASMALDAGAQGVVAPYVESLEEVLRVLAAVKYRPLKGRAARLAAEEGEFPSQETKTYLEMVNGNNLLGIGIESLAAVEALDTLAGVDGVDFLYVGPQTLSLELGIPNQYTHQAFIQTVERILEVAARHRKPAMIHLYNHEMAKTWLEKGTSLVLFGTDRRALSEGFHADFEFLRAINPSPKKPHRANLRLVHPEDPDR